jgi:hypothetical protein
MSDMTGDDQPQHQTSPTQGPDGTYVATPETAERDAEAARLRGRGLSYRAIAAELGVDVHTAHDAVKRALTAIRAEPAEEVRTLELERLDRMWDAVLAVLEREHITVSQGRVVRKRVLDEAGDPIIVGTDKDDKPIFREEEVLDDGPVLNAVDRLLRIQQRRAALLGLDMPAKVDVGGQLRYEIVGVEMDKL